MKDCFVIGLDYGTDSVRSVIINAYTGEEAASSVFFYPRWKDGLYCDAGKQQFRQHPLDYIEGLEQTIKDCLKKAGRSVADRSCLLLRPARSEYPPCCGESAAR